MTTKEKEILSKIQNYFITLSEKERLSNLLNEEGSFEGSVTASFSLDGGSRSNTFSSKPENGVMRKMNLERRIKELETDIEFINSIHKYINDQENEIIGYIIEGRNMSEIADKLNIKRKRVERIRNKALSKLTRFYNFNNTN